MLTILGTIFGLLGSMIPEVLKVWRTKLDHQHELAVLQIQAEMAKSEHLYKLEEINVQGDIASEQAVYKAAEIKPTGVKIADALLVIYNGTVRPTIAYAYFALYALVKYAMYLLLMNSTTEPWYKTVVQLWGSEDMAVFSTIMAFYYGGRFMKYAMERYGVGLPPINGNGNGNNEVFRNVVPVPEAPHPKEPKPNKPKPGEIFDITP